MNKLDRANLGTRRGYIALVSVILLSAVMSVVVIGVSLGTFLGRLDILKSDFKEQSQGLSEACVQVARLKLVENSAYAGNEIIAVGSSTCQILAVTASGTQKIVLTQGVVQNSYTNLRATLNASATVVIGMEQL